MAGRSATRLTGLFGGLFLRLLSSLFPLRARLLGSLGLLLRLLGLTFRSRTLLWTLLFLGLCFGSGSRFGVGQFNINPDLGGMGLEAEKALFRETDDLKLSVLPLDVQLGAPLSIAALTSFPVAVTSLITVWHLLRVGGHIYPFRSSSETSMSS